jgi:hypothetical protein
MIFNKKSKTEVNVNRSYSVILATLQITSYGQPRKSNMEDILSKI